MRKIVRSTSYRILNLAFIFQADVNFMKLMKKIQRLRFHILAIELSTCVKLKIYSNPLNGIQPYLQS